MALDFEVVKTDIYDWVKLIYPSVPVIFLNQNAPRPALPYITLYLQTVVQIGQDYIPKSDINGNAEIVGNREFVIQIQTYGGDCITRMETLRSSLQLPSVLATLNLNNIVFVQQMPILDISQLLDTEFEPRAGMDVLFRMAQVQSDALGKIENLEYEETFSDGENIVYQETILIETP